MHGSACFLITLLRVSTLATFLLCYFFCNSVRFLCIHTLPPLLPGIRGLQPQPHWLVLRRSRNEPFSVTSHGASLQAGLVSQELLDALTAVDDKLCSACLFAEYWRFLCTHTLPPLIPRDQRTAPQPQWLDLRRSRNEPISVTPLVLAL